MGLYGKRIAAALGPYRDAPRVEALQLSQVVGGSLALLGYSA